nr:transposase, MuDR, MULE transposase domain protein [Tanacetum cinerariifolium]
MHLNLWVLYLWHYRPEKADWVIASPFFNTFMLGNKFPCCYADGVTYDVPWFAQSVKKVYFPINVEEIHWIVAELHIRSGVVTFCDNLPMEDLHVEDQKWWLGMRESYAYQILNLLLETKVLEKKIDPTNYSISYRYAVNVPKQGDTYVDCGTYLGTNLLAVGIDGNNQIIPIATDVSQGETGPSWTWKMCKAYSPEDFHMAINELGAKRLDIYQKLIEAGVERWSRAYCPNDRYNYMTSNLVKSINALTRDVRKIPIINLIEWYRDLVQRWYCERRVTTVV